MVIRQSNKAEWADFDQAAGANTFSSESDKSTTANTNVKPKKQQGNSSTSWMQEPIQANESWVPVELPAPVIVNAGAPSGLGRPPSPASRNSSHSRNGFSQPEGSSHHRHNGSHSRRARSPSPNPGGPKPVILTQQPPSRGRSRPQSRERPLQNDGSVRPPKNRGRSNSRNRSLPQEKRERSISQTRSIGGASHASARSQRSHSGGGSGEQQQAKNRGRSRPPVTARNGRESQGHRSRGRSHSASRDGRTRLARSRSASLTRVTNQPQAPPSPGIRSVKSASHAMSKPPAAPQGSSHSQHSRSRHGSHHSRGGSYVFEESEHNANALHDSVSGKPKSGASVCSSDGRRKKKAMGKLLSDQPTGNKSGEGGMGDQIRPRVLLAATVYHNTATGLWITTINTNQKGVARDPKLANKYLKAFSFPSEQEARESAIANAPPKMIPFAEGKVCFLCNCSFTVFKRASHCRNCGVCICKECSVTWPSKNIPDTYNLKNETTVKVCRSCNTISRAFRRALIQGDYDGAVALHGTGNVNLRTPFPPSGKKDEMMWPVHCAVEGGNLNILRWLVDDHFCPITTIPSGGSKKPRRGSPESLILTSNGRNCLSIAVERLKVEIMQYLVVDKGVSIYESTELQPSLRALEATLIALPRPSDMHHRADEVAEPRWDNGSYDDMSVPSTIGVDSAKQAAGAPSALDDNATVGSKSKNSDYCIICFERKIDCVATPCGHQVCCLTCSENLSSCPVCNHKGDFIKIFRP